MKRPEFLHLLAAALVVAAACLIFRQAGQNHPGRTEASPSPRRGPRTESQRSATEDPAACGPSSATTLATASSNPIKPAPPSATAMERTQPAKQSAAGASAAGRTSRETTGNSPPATASAKTPDAAMPERGIQLAKNVKLPAAIMALADPAYQNLTPQQHAALQHVADAFYQDLATKAQARLANQESPGGQLVQAPDGGETLVIQPGPDVEHARQRANELFRALFGDDRYNQFTMQSAMELSVPVQ